MNEYRLQHNAYPPTIQEGTYGEQIGGPRFGAAWRDRYGAHVNLYRGANLVKVVNASTYRKAQRILLQYLKGYDV